MIEMSGFDFSLPSNLIKDNNVIHIFALSGGVATELNYES